MKNFRLLHLWLLGLIIAAVYGLLETLYHNKVENFPLTAFLWFASIVLGASSIYLGFDYDRIKFSSSLSFLAVISILYLFTIGISDLEGLPMVVGFLLLPFTTASVFGSIKNYIEGKKSARMKGTYGAPLSRRFKAILYELDPIIWVFILVSVVYLALFLIAPIIYMLRYAFVTGTGNPLENFIRIFRNPNAGFVRPYLLPIDSNPFPVENVGGIPVVKIIGWTSGYGVVLNSLIIATIVTIFATILGILIAFTLARFNFKGKELLRIIAIIPLFVTPFVNAYAVKLLFSSDGPISRLFYLFTGHEIELTTGGVIGVIVTQIITFYPIVYLNAYSSFINIDPSMEEQAENLGSKGLRLFLNVTLPLSLPGIAAGAILVYIFSLEDLGAPIVWNFRNVMSYYIFSNFQSYTNIISPESAALGVIMLLYAIMGFLAIRNYVSAKSYAMISRGGRLVSRARKPGILATIGIYLFIFPLAVLTAFPQISVVLLALKLLSPSQWSFLLTSDVLYYLESFLSVFKDPNVFNGILNTLKYATISVTIGVILAIMIGYSVSRVKIRWLSNSLDSIATMPIAIPGLVVALGYWFFFKDFAEVTGISFLDPVNIAAFQLWIILIISFSIRRLPYVVRSVFAGFQQVHVNLEEAAMNLGAKRTKVVFGVVFPFILSYVLSGALLGFVYMSTEVTTSITLGGLKQDQAPVTYWLYMYTQKATAAGIPSAAAIGTLLLLIQLIAVVIVIFVFKQKYAFIGV